MTKLAWVTDLHLDLVTPASRVEGLISELGLDEPSISALLITGDISQSQLLAGHLLELSKSFSRPIYFVLGNHDYYQSSFEAVDRQVGRLELPNVHWLNKEMSIFLNEETALVGVGGWYDARYGNLLSSVVLTDWARIHDLRGARYQQGTLIEVLRRRAKQEAKLLESQLRVACEADVTTIIVATHVPPYPEASWYRGQLGNRDYLPWTTNYAVGQVLDRFASWHPEKKFLVLCGHTHWPSTYFTDNLSVYAGESDYGHPSVSGFLDCDERKIVISANGSPSEDSF